MIKIVICGVERSGKTCYFYGMLGKLMRGANSFIIRTTAKFDELRTAISRLADTKLPDNERYPLPSSELQRYQLDLVYQMQFLDNIDWIDYPGELVANARDAFISELKSADCLLICVDGDCVNWGGDWNADDTDQIVNRFTYNAGGLALSNALTTAAMINKRLPPVCVMVTKYDKVPDDFRNQHFFVDGFTEYGERKDGVLKSIFPTLFDVNGGAPVTTCGVSLGANIDMGGPLNPKHVEKPILFATYWKLKRDYRELVNAMNKRIEGYNAELTSYNNKGFWSKLFAQMPQRPFTDAEKADYQNRLDTYKRNLEGLKQIVNTLPHYRDGQECSMEDFDI